MFRSIMRLGSLTRGQHKPGEDVILLSRMAPLQTSARCLGDGVKDRERTKERFDTSLLELLVCPLSKKTLRYDEETNELINDELGIAYPIIDGIPNMIPQDARMIHTSPDKEEPVQS